MIDLEVHTREQALVDAICRWLYINAFGVGSHTLIGFCARNMFLPLLYIKITIRNEAKSECKCAKAKFPPVYFVGKVVCMQKIIN